MSQPAAAQVVDGRPLWSGLTRPFAGHDVVATFVPVHRTVGMSTALRRLTRDGCGAWARHAVLRTGSTRPAARPRPASATRPRPAAGTARFQPPAARPRAEPPANPGSPARPSRSAPPP